MAAVMPHQKRGGGDEGAQKKDHEDGVGGQIHGAGGQEVDNGGNDLPPDHAGPGLCLGLVPRQHSQQARAKRRGSPLKSKKYNMI